MFAIINSPIFIFPKLKFTLVYSFPSLSYYIFVSLVSYRYTLKETVLNIMRLYTFIIKATRELKSFNHSFSGQSLFSYKSIVLQTRIIFTFTYYIHHHYHHYHHHHHHHHICLPLSRKVHFLYYIACICL